MRRTHNGVSRQRLLWDLGATGAWMNSTLAYPPQFPISPNHTLGGPRTGSRSGLTSAARDGHLRGWLNTQSILSSKLRTRSSSERVEIAGARVPPGVPLRRIIIFDNWMSMGSLTSSFDPVAAQYIHLMRTASILKSPEWRKIGWHSECRCVENRNGGQQASEASSLVFTRLQLC